MIGAGAREHLLALADDEHLMGQQHTEWIGVAPFLEEDLAFCSIAQDELGHAAALYELLADDADADDARGAGGADALAFGRDASAYRSCHLVELPCADWADALARHWLYDLAEVRRWDALAGSADPAVGALVARVAREEVYHRRHAAVLVDRLLASDDDAGTRLRRAIAAVMPLADALWEPVAGEDEAHRTGVITATSTEGRARWRADVAAVIGPVAWDDLPVPDQRGRTRRSEHFAALHARINEVFAVDPTARW